MIEVRKIYELLLLHSADFFTGVPDSLLKDLCAYITDYAPREKNIIAANEGCAVGIAAGYHMATGKIPVVYMQNSGIGNAVNPLLSLMDEKVYRLPVLLIVGWRGEPGVKDEPQHKKQGEVTPDLLQAMQIPYVVLDREEESALQQTEKMLSLVKRESVPGVLLVRKDTFASYRLQYQLPEHYPLSREAALQTLVSCLKEEDIVVSTTGKLSRELFEYRESCGEGHARDFLTVGSMGHSSSIALGIALQKTGRNVFCLDGDGAFIMHMGALTNIGTLAPPNYCHVVFNNGVHESVGGQPTVAFQIDIPAIAKACGYKKVISINTEEEIKKVFTGLKETEGPVFVEIKVKVASRKDLGRPTTTPLENKKDFMDNLKK